MTSEMGFHARPTTRNSQLATSSPGYTLIELATTVAALVIVLGLMVSLARYVREQSSQALTASLLRKLDAAVGRYQAKNGGKLPEVPAILGDGETPDEAAIRRRAMENNGALVAALRRGDALGGEFADLSIASYDETHVRDAWGSPIVFMAGQHPAIGMAPQNRFFLFSAGPDRQYLTRTDNLYGYEGK